MTKQVRVCVNDIETISNLYLMCLYDVRTKEKLHFVVHKLWDDFDKVIEYLDDNLIHISYNGLAFDGQVLQWVWNNRNVLKEMDSESRACSIYAYSQSLIDKQNNGGFLDFYENSLRIKEIDLFKIWHFNNKAKATSLKWVQFMIDWHDVREMPIHHSTHIETLEQIHEIISYCYNDVMSTYELYRITRGATEIKEYKGKDKIEFRESIKKIINQECVNWNDVKIGAELNYINYTKSIYEKYGYAPDKKELKAQVVKKNTVALKDCIPDYIYFKTKYLQDLLDDVKGTVAVQDEFGGWNKFERNIKIGKTLHKMRLGGIHSCEKPRVIKPMANEKLEDADVGSQYPSAIAKRGLKPSHLDEVWSGNITFNIIKRIDLKPASKKDKQVAAFCEAIKLSLNGGAYGKLGEENDWQYDPECMYSVTIGCQFEILMLIEELELAGINVISSNTDGIVSLYDRSLEKEYYRICKEWETKVKVSDKAYGKLEFQEYSKMIQTSVNDYIAVKPDGEIKKKGDFMTEFELHKNKSKRVIPLALEQYFVNGISPKTFIRNHKNIFDFCIGVKAKGEWKFEARSIQEGIYNVEQLHKIIRYYISNDGVKLIKCASDGRESQAEAGKWMQTVLNKYQDMDMIDYNINYNYYIQSVYDIINKIDSDITVNYTQTSLF